jgi:excisionase family DNA binding protein
MNRKLTTAQAAVFVGVSDQTVANWIDQGHLPAGRTAGGHRRIETGDLVAFLKKQKLRVPPGLGRAFPTILIVDDDPEVAAWLCRAIAASYPDCRTLVANDGYSAGEIVIAEKPDVVILDLYMPGLDGFAVCRKMKSRPSTNETIVIALTGYHSPEVERDILGAGAVACLAKPVAFNVIHQLLNKLLAAKQ